MITAFSILLLGWFGWQIVTSNHTLAWKSLPLIGVFFILATAAGVLFFQNTMLSILHALLG
jgi:TRAP-type C4-dicarboxylate transport system permease small subunit